MRSHEVLKRAADRIGVKALAATLRLSPALVYKWCQESDVTDPDASGARNPMDRLADIIRATGDVNVVNWLCHEAGGYFAPNPKVKDQQYGADLLIRTQGLVSDFGELLSAVTRSVQDDGYIEPEEADEIRAAWEQLKSTVEQFAVACERGFYRHHEEK